jgi:hypothetical protein
MIRERMNYVRKNEVLYVFPENGESAGDGRDARKD